MNRTLGLTCMPAKRVIARTKRARAKEEKEEEESLKLTLLVHGSVVHVGR